MVGRIMMTSVRPPARIPAFRPMSWRKKSIPTRPKMMEGMPVRVSVANSMMATTFRFVAYSVR